MPAPPPESEPAMVQTMGGLVGWCEGYMEEEEVEEQEGDAMWASGWWIRLEMRLRTGTLLLGFDVCCG